MVEGAQRPSGWRRLLQGKRRQRGADQDLSGVILAKPSDFVALHGRGVSLILETARGAAPLWRYFGPRLPDGATPGGLLRDGRVIPTFALDADQPLSVFPTFGAGWFHQSALLAHRAGADFCQAWTSASMTQATPGRALRIDLADDVAKIAVTINIAIDPGSDTLTIETSIENRGAAPLDVQWLAAATLPLPSSIASVRYYAGRHNHEFEECEEPLGRALWRRENRRGLTSHESFPGALALGEGAGRDAGLAYGAQLAWSGNHAQLIERLDDGGRQWQFGEWLAPGEARLAPGERLQAPAALATCSTAGTNGVAANFHRAIRQRISWPGGAMRPRPVHLNTWEAAYFDHDVGELKGLADAAAAIGVERFVLDDGWFKGRAHDAAGLGDWTVDARKYPQGLRPLADHVIAAGMEFGLWIEPEMVNPDSDLFRAHPDWALAVKGRAQITARNQLVLDLARAEVSDHLFAALDALLNELPVSYLKWDHNRDLALAGGADGRAAYRRQTLAAYRLIDRLRAAHPAVEIEACAGGGGRIDAGIIARTHRFWTSDCLDALERLSIHRGFLQFMPPEIMGAHVGAAPSHATGRVQSIDFRAAAALPGHFGVELDVRKLGDADRAALASWIARYKSLRRLLHGGETWLGEAGDRIFWQAHGSALEAAVFVYRTAPASDRQAPPLRLPMLDPSRVYKLRILAAAGHFPFRPQRRLVFEALNGEGARFDGAWLIEAGLPLPPLPAEGALILYCSAC